MKSLMLVFFTAAVAISSATVTNYSFEGTFLTDDQVELFDFTLSSQSTVTLQSLGYAGGTNAASTVIPPGGFDSFFTWFDSTGTQIGTNDDGGCGNVNVRNDACLDAFANITLPAGSYVLALTQSGNDPNGDLGDGFGEQGQGNFTASGACTAFCDTFGNTSNGNWAVDILNVTSASVEGATPEPATVALSGVGLSLLLLGAARRRRLSSTGR